KIEIREQSLFARDPSVLQDEAEERFAGEGGYEQIGAPFRESGAVIKGDPGGRDIGRPGVHGLLPPGLRGPVAVGRFAAVLPAVADHGEPIVPPLVDRVDFVAAARTMLARPEPARARLDRDALHVAQTDRIDLVPGTGAADEWVVAGNRPIAANPQ